MSEVTTPAAPDAALANPAAPVTPATPAPGSPPPAFVIDKQVWGDLTPEFPEGFEDSFKNEPSLKSFVGKDNKFNVANVLKSYVHAKKTMGVDRVLLPKEDADQASKEEFWNKVGWPKDASAHKLTLDEKTAVLDPEFVEKFKQETHKLNMPTKMAQNLLEKLDATTKESLAAEQVKFAEDIKVNLGKLQQEWGASYDGRISLTKRMLKDSGVDVETLKVFDDPAISSNTSLIKTLHAIAARVYKEDTATTPTPTGGLSPQDAEKEIARIRNDRSHPFNNRSHSGHAIAVKEMEALYYQKKGMRPA